MLSMGLSTANYERYMDYVRVLKSQRMPEVKRPGWLAEGRLDWQLPISELLPDSVFYPGSGLDPDPLRYLGHHFWSFVYADYGYDRKDVIEAIGSRSFPGYKLIGSRSVNEWELPLERWNTETFGRLAEGMPEGDNTEVLSRTGRSSFAEWIVLERNYGPDRPVELMSLLFIGADGVTLLEKLYVENGVTPACVCIIQAPPAMGGGNWTCFEDENQVFAQTLKHNPAGTPRFLLRGGSGRPDCYRKPCWPTFGSLVAWPLARTRSCRREDLIPFEKNLREGALSLWERTE
jgi:hypothetical protein